MKMEKQNINVKSPNLILIPILIIGLALLPKAQAVSPAPDGGYPGGNTAEGQSALLRLTTGAYNTAVGLLSLRSNDTGGYNTATGAGALLSNTDGFSNTADGVGALVFNTTGHDNTALGVNALHDNTTGGTNIGIGQSGGYLLTTGNYNIDIGDFGVAGESATIRIGATGLQTTTYIAGIAGQTVGAGGSTCYVDNAGKLGVFLSARRFKTDIADMGAASEAILALRPVTFHYTPELDKTGIPQFGLVAEEVAKVNPDLVTHDAKGELSTVRYEAVNAMLLNEFLKEHKKVGEQQKQIEKQEATIAQLKSAVAKQETAHWEQQKEIQALAAGLKDQTAQIQRVSAQVKIKEQARQTIANK